MSPARAHAVAARLGLAAALLMFSLMVLGSVVRTTGSGLACPDWPLCEGRLIPRFEYHVLLEWGHRLVALVLSTLLFALAVFVFARRDLRFRLGGLMGLALVLLFAQVVLGALTVWKLLSPAIVSGHLAVALLLFATLLTLTLAADAEAEPHGAFALPRPPGLFALIGAATALTWAQAVLGGVVSSSHAGAVCPDWPACNGRWPLGFDSLEGIQMLHRGLAYVLVAVVIAAAAVARPVRDEGVRGGARMALTLVAAQVVLGVCNALLAAPVWLSAIHLATAAASLAVLVTVTYRVALMPSGSAARILAMPGVRA